MITLWTCCYPRLSGHAQLEFSVYDDTTLSVSLLYPTSAVVLSLAASVYDLDLQSQYLVSAKNTGMNLTVMHKHRTGAGERSRTAFSGNESWECGIGAAVRRRALEVRNRVKADGGHTRMEAAQLIASGCSWVSV